MPQITNFDEYSEELALLNKDERTLLDLRQQDGWRRTTSFSADLEGLGAGDLAALCKIPKDSDIQEIRLFIDAAGAVSDADLLFKLRSLSNSSLGDTSAYVFSDTNDDEVDGSVSGVVTLYPKGAGDGIGEAVALRTAAESVLAVENDESTALGAVKIRGYVITVKR